MDTAVDIYDILLYYLLEKFYCCFFFLIEMKILVFHYLS